MKTNTTKLTLLTPSDPSAPCQAFLGQQGRKCLLSSALCSPKSSDCNLLAAQRAVAQGPWGQHGSQPAQGWVAERLRMLSPASPRPKGLPGTPEELPGTAEPSCSTRQAKAVPAKGCVSSHWRCTRQARGQSAERMFWTLLGRVDHIWLSLRGHDRRAGAQKGDRLGWLIQAGPAWLCPGAPSAFHAFPKT